MTERASSGLTSGRCMAMRLKGKPPHPDWPIRYPYEDSKKGPIRAIDDIENYLVSIITDGPPPFSETEVPTIQPPSDEPYIQRHVHVYEPDPEIEDDIRLVFPAAWIPPQVLGRGAGENKLEN